MLQVFFLSNNLAIFIAAFLLNSVGLIFEISELIDTQSGKLSLWVLIHAFEISIAPTHLKPALSKPRDNPPAPQNKSIKFLATVLF